MGTENEIGGILITVNDIRKIFDFSHPNYKDQKPKAIAFKSTGYDPWSGKYSCKMKAYAIYFIEDKYKYVHNQFVEIKTGIIFNTENSVYDPKNIKFEHHEHMSNQAGTNKPFCFGFVTEEEINEFLKFHEKSDGEDNILITSILFNHREKDTFGLALQDYSDPESGMTLTAPCPPYWRPGAPTNNKDAFKKEIELLKELSESVDEGVKFC